MKLLITLLFLIFASCSVLASDPDPPKNYANNPHIPRRGNFFNMEELSDTIDGDHLTKKWRTFDDYWSIKRQQEPGPALNSTSTRHFKNATKKAYNKTESCFLQKLLSSFITQDSNCTNDGNREIDQPKFSLTGPEPPGMQHVLGTSELNKSESDIILPRVDNANVEEPRVGIPNMVMPRRTMPRFEMPKFEMPRLPFRFG